MFKPDLNFAGLLETGIMSADELRAAFGRTPEQGDIAWARESFRAKHPEAASLIRYGQGRLYLMGSRQARAYRRSRVGSAITGLNTAIELHERVPVGELSADEKRQHRVECDAITQLKITANPLRKPLPGQKDR